MDEKELFAALKKLTVQAKSGEVAMGTGVICSALVNFSAYLIVLETRLQGDRQAITNEAAKAGYEALLEVINRKVEESLSVN